MARMLSREWGTSSLQAAERRRTPAREPEFFLRTARFAFVSGGVLVYERQPPTDVNQLVAIAAEADRLQLPFLLGGGHAVVTHGFPRTTFDLDLIVRRPDRGRWLQFAKTLGYAMHREGETFLQFDAPREGFFPLDLMLVNEDTFSRLRADAVPAPASAPGVWVVSLMHLLALKCHAIKHGHAGRIVKDADDVLRLVQNNGLDPNAPALRELFEKHGTKDLYEKVRRACRRE
jgi:hypothetical protein